MDPSQNLPESKLKTDEPLAPNVRLVDHATDELTPKKKSHKRVIFIIVSIIVILVGFGVALAFFHFNTSASLTRFTNDKWGYSMLVPSRFSRWQDDIDFVNFIDTSKKPNPSKLSLIGVMVSSSLKEKTDAEAAAFFDKLMSSKEKIAKSGNSLEKDVVFNKYTKDGMVYLVESGNYVDKSGKQNGKFKDISILDSSRISYYFSVSAYDVDPDVMNVIDKIADSFTLK